MQATQYTCQSPYASPVQSERVDPSSQKAQVQRSLIYMPNLPYRNSLLDCDDKKDCFIDL